MAITPTTMPDRATEISYLQQRLSDPVFLAGVLHAQLWRVRPDPGTPDDEKRNAAIASIAGDLDLASVQLDGPLSLVERLRTVLVQLEDGGASTT